MIYFNFRTEIINRNRKDDHEISSDKFCLGNYQRIFPEISHLENFVYMIEGLKYILE